MTAKYLLRFDDLCPTSKWSVWDEIEATLIDLGIRPLLAVVPDNQDPFLRVEDPDPRFWSRVRDWQARGWTIGMHGYQHVCVTDNGGILSLNPCSEFAGLALEEQEQSLRKGLSVFAAEGVTPSVFVAPSHSFDLGTVMLLGRVGIPAISDGFTLWPFKDADGVTWIPQQFWRLRWMPFGVYTICIHPNGWSRRDVVGFRKRLHRFRDRIVDFETVCRTYEARRFSRLDLVPYAGLPLLTRAKRSTKRWRKRPPAPTPVSGEGPKRDRLPIPDGIQGREES